MHDKVVEMRKKIWLQASALLIAGLLLVVVWGCGGIQPAKPAASEKAAVNATTASQAKAANLPIAGGNQKAEHRKSDWNR